MRGFLLTLKTKYRGDGEIINEITEELVQGEYVSRKMSWDVEIDGKLNDLLEYGVQESDGEESSDDGDSIPESDEESEDV
jgi:hypothetical protein